MKKLLFTILIAVGLLIPLNVLAAPKASDYQTENLLETINQENEAIQNASSDSSLSQFPRINLSFSNLQENDNQVTVYLFRGLGCINCHNLITYLNSIYPEYGKYFKVVSFEIYYDGENNQLLSEVGNFFGYRDSDIGVPFMIIGDQVFVGYGESMNDAIIATIESEYKKDKNDRYDLFEAMQKAEDDKLNGGNTNTTAVIIWNAIIVLAATAVIVAVLSVQHSKVQDRLDVIYQNLGINIDEEKIESSKENKSKEENIDDEDYEIKKNSNTKKNKSKK